MVFITKLLALVAIYTLTTPVLACPYYRFLAVSKDLGPVCGWKDDPCRIYPKCCAGLSCQWPLEAWQRFYKGKVCLPPPPPGTRERLFAWS
ncbi:hypothetical protein CDD82_1701 [Ophiocordyceps australis]|uniref:Uncharacterized protein n=1 Tax=Ophiocordyceps australis TaxID=1399860 RepID=A0A2C5XAR9_9HYPO|nr:hypothetical protein CDD82_1701 [Ophiocordyceps australis]